jgi:hypothetical protein
MDETLQELENELKRLTPRRPSGALMRAVGNELGASVSAAPVRQDRPVPVLRLWQWDAWSIAAAAAIAFVAVFQLTRRASAPQPVPEVAKVSTPSDSTPRTLNRYEPVQATSVLYDLKEDGAAVLTDQSEGRQVRYRYVDTYTWKNPNTNASLRWSVPRDEVRLIRASLD